MITRFNTRKINSNELKRKIKKKEDSNIPSPVRNISRNQDHNGILINVNQGNKHPTRKTIKL